MSEETKVEVVNDEPVLPKMGTQEWTDYILEMMKPEELPNGYPTADGLRSVVHALGWFINHANAKVAQAPSSVNDHVATVEYTISVNTEPNNKYAGSIFGGPSTNRTVTEVSDASARYIKDPYRKNLSATAATKAEGRALRKLLCLKNVLTSEEMKDEEEAEGLISEIQKTAITTLCRKTKLDLNKAVEAIINKPLDKCNSTEAKVITQELNKYRDGKNTIDLKNCGV